MSPGRQFRKSHGGHRESTGMLPETVKEYPSASEILGTDIRIKKETHCLPPAFLAPPGQDLPHVLIDTVREVGECSGEFLRFAGPFLLGKTCRNDNLNALTVYEFRGRAEVNGIAVDCPCVGSGHENLIRRGVNAKRPNTHLTQGVNIRQHTRLTRRVKGTLPFLILLAAGAYRRATPHATHALQASRATRPWPTPSSPANNTNQPGSGMIMNPFSRVPI